MVKTLPNYLVYTALFCVIAFVVFFGIFSGTYFYKHCIKQTFVSDEEQIGKMPNQKERYNILLQRSNLEEENNSNSMYLVPVSNAYYEEIESNAETVNWPYMQAGVLILDIGDRMNFDF